MKECICENKYIGMDVQGTMKYMHTTMTMLYVPRTPTYSTHPFTAPATCQPPRHLPPCLGLPAPPA